MDLMIRDYLFVVFTFVILHLLCHIYRIIVYVPILLFLTGYFSNFIIITCKKGFAHRVVDGLVSH